MKSNRAFFTPQLSAELMKARKRADVTRAELARRPGFSEPLGQGFDKIETGPFARQLVPELVRKVREIVERYLP